jgi:hypothetical protein
MIYRWANPERTAVIRESVPVAWIDAGPEFEAARRVALPYLSPRAQMVATRRQIRLALGEAGCNAMDDAANDPALPWSMREQMKSAHEWHRSAPEIDEFAWLMGMTPDDVDALFAVAMTL